MHTKISTLLVALCFAAPGAAQSDVKISKKPTQNMTCSQGVCSPTAKKAVLNATDLANMLAAGNITVASDARAQDILINAALSWTSQHRLTLDSFHSIVVNKPVTVAGNGELTITTNDGGTGGDYRFFGKGHVAFWGTKNGPLIINNQPYLVAAGITKLRSLIHHGNRGFYAIAKDIDAKGEQYSASPIDEFAGTLEGLGNTISNLEINATGGQGPVGLLGELDNASATIRDIGILNVNISASTPVCAGALVGGNASGNILNSYAAGKISLTGPGAVAGGMVCANQFGTVSRSHAAVAVSGGDSAVVAGLVGVNEAVCNAGRCTGMIDQNYSLGDVNGGVNSTAGGFVGRNFGGSISNSYTSGSVTVGGNGLVGGLVGSNENNIEEGSTPEIATSYSIGAVTGGPGATIGGLIGSDTADPGITDGYWDLDTSGVNDPHQGAGNVQDDPGITGLTDEQLKSELPAGFDPMMWAQSSKTNNGYPYLIAIAPQ